MSQQDKAVLGFALFVVSLVVDLVSDIFIRGHHIVGASPGSWDVICTVGVLLGLLLIVDAAFDVVRRIFGE